MSHLLPRSQIPWKRLSTWRLIDARLRGPSLGFRIQLLYTGAGEAMFWWDPRWCWESSALEETPCSDLGTWLSSPEVWEPLCISFFQLGQKPEGQKEFWQPGTVRGHGGQRAYGEEKNFRDVVSPTSNPWEINMLKNLGWVSTLEADKPGSDWEFCHPFPYLTNTSMVLSTRHCCKCFTHMKWKSLSCIRLFATPWTIQSMEFSCTEYWSGQPFPSPGDLPNLGLEPRRILYQLSHEGSPFAHKSSFNLHKKKSHKVGSERLSSVPKVTKLGSGRTGVQAQAAALESMFLNSTSCYLSSFSPLHFVTVSP